MSQNPVIDNASRRKDQLDELEVRGYLDPDLRLGVAPPAGLPGDHPSIADELACQALGASRAGQTGRPR